MPEQKRILIVDNDPEVHRLLVEALGEEGREIASAFDAGEGLRRVEETGWDLVMAEAGLLEKIHAVRPSARVVVMTVKSTPESIVMGIRDHAYAWFTKPFQVGAVRDLVDGALANTFSDDDIQVISASPTWLGLKLRCKMETAARILQFIREMSQGLLHGHERENVATAFREILLNAIEHGGRNDPTKSVAITYVRARGAMLYYVGDPGQGFSFSALRHAAVSNEASSPMEHAEVRQELGMRSGGFGILMTRSLVDELIYNDRGNEVLLIKYLKA